MPPPSPHRPPAARGVRARTVAGALAALAGVVALTVLSGSRAASEDTAGGTATSAEQKDATGQTAPGSLPSPAATSPAAGTTTRQKHQPPKPSAEPPIELQPYRVLVRLGMPHDAEFDPLFRNAIRRRLATVTGNTLGQMWVLTVAEDAALHPNDQTALERLAADDFSADERLREFDKVYCVTVEPGGHAIDVWAREWDATVQRLGPIVSARTHDRRAVGDAIFRALWAAFEPVVQLKLVDGDVIHVRVRAGEFPPAVPEYQPVRPGRILQPFFRHYNRDRSLRAVQPIPWTYLIVDSVNRGRARCHVASGLRINLGARRRRVQTVAIGIRPHLPQTEVRLALRNAPTKSLVAYRVSVYDRKPDLKNRAKKAASPDDTREKASPADGQETAEASTGSDSERSTADGEKPERGPLMLMSDRRGLIRVPANPQRPLVWLFISGGKYLLAMVPFVPGTVEQTDLLLPDDSIRLSVVARLELLKAEFVETIARRAVLMSRIRRHTRKGEKEQATRLMDELQKLPDNKYYHDELEAIQFAAVQEARQRRNRLAESRVKVLCKTVRELVDKFLPADGLEKFKEQLKELEEEASLENTSPAAPSDGVR